MKIAHVVTTFYDTNATGWVTALAADQLTRGCQVHLVVGRNAAPELLARRQAQGFKVIQVPSLRKYVRPAHEIQALLDPYRLCRSEGYDLVHTHLAKAGVIGRLAAHLAGVPRVIHSVYGATFAATQSWLRRGLFRELESLAGRVTDTFIFVGQELREAYCRAGVCPPERGRVIYYGKNLSPFFAVAALSRQERQARRAPLGLGPNDLVLGNVSRLVPWKGLDYAVEIVGRLKDRFPGLKLIIVGDAKTPSEQGYKRRLLKKVHRRGLAGHIIFTGWVPNPAPYFAVFDLYLLTSMPLEGVPGAVIEAAGSGVPVVGFDCFGVREIPGVEATLVPSGNVRALTEAVREKLLCLAAGMSNDNGTRRTEHWRQISLRFDLDKMVQETWKVYQHALRN
ncbi:MAG: glycosyltransferase [Desulfobaccales bacterium]